MPDYGTLCDHTARAAPHELGFIRLTKSCGQIYLIVPIVTCRFYTCYPTLAGLEDMSKLYEQIAQKALPISTFAPMLLPPVTPLVA